MPEQDITHRTAMMVGLIIAVSMTSIDQTIVALTGPTIQRDLGITHGPMQWAVNVYLIATAAFFLLGGRAVRRPGTSPDGADRDRGLREHLSAVWSRT